MDLSKIDWSAILPYILGGIVPILLPMFPGLNNILKLLPRQFWDVCVKLAGGTITWNNPVQFVPVVGPDGSPVFGADGQPQVKAVSTPSKGLLDNVDLQKWIPIIAIGAVVFFVIRGCDNNPKPAPAPTPTPASSAAPSPDLQSLVAPIRSLAAAKPDAARALAGYYAAGADVLRRDATNVGTVTQLRDAKIKSDALYVQRSPLVGSLPGIGAAVDSVLAQTVGLDDVALDSAKRQKAVEAFEAIAWALGA